MTKTTLAEPTTALRSRSLKDLRGYEVLAADGDVGKVVDLYFDDVTWNLRYFVVETGRWLNKRRVLVSPTAFTESDGARTRINTTLTRKQIENAPHAELDKPVSRQFEIELHQYYAWPTYWVHGPETLRDEGPSGDSHLRSVQEVLGYGIRANDGEFGHVEDLIADERSWTIRYLAIDTRNWLPGKKVLISPMWATRVDWPNREVSVDLDRATIKDAPEFDPSQPVNRAYEARLFDYYGRPRYWD